MDESIFSYKDIIGPSYAGFDVYESIQMTDEMEDWSKVRSPARKRDVASPASSSKCGRLSYRRNITLSF
jgi:hypothetical protein